MQRPELVLSNTTSFFSGRIETVFKNAKKYGFKYVEIVPYRWTDVEEILELEKKYGVQAAGIHLPVWWKKPVWSMMPNLLEKLFAPIWGFYLGSAQKSPGLALAEKLSSRRPYVLFHANVVREMGQRFDKFTKNFHVLIENLPYFKISPRFFWDPLEIKKEMEKRNLKVSQVFDHGHFLQNLDKLNQISPEEIYRQAAPEVIHISYNSRFIHLLPSPEEQIELKKLLRVHTPKYITIETNPLVSIKRGKQLLDQIINESRR